MVDLDGFDGLDWEGAGYSGAPSPSPEDQFPDPVTDAPWTAFAIVIANAKAGDFLLAHRLLDALTPDCSNFLRSQITDVLADIASDALVDRIAAAVAGDASRMDGYLLLDFCEIIAFRGRLSDVPVLLDAYASKRYLRDAEIVPILLSDMLEGVPGSIADYGSCATLDDYRALVTKRQAKLTDAHGPDARVYFGEPYSVERLARLALVRARSGLLDSNERKRFEAATGIDCCAFYEDGDLQPLRAAAILEEFLDSESVAHYRPGQRYFFGHPL